MGLCFRKPKKLRTEINVINLIDVMFMINIFLLITTSFSASTGAIDVSLPKTTQAKSITNEANRNMEVKIDKMEKIYVNNSRISIEKLKGMFVERQMLSQKTNLVISADAMCSHGKIVEVLDLAKKHGISELSIATENTIGDKNERKYRAMSN